MLEVEEVEEEAAEKVVVEEEVEEEEAVEEEAEEVEAEEAEVVVDEDMATNLTTLHFPHTWAPTQMTNGTV